MNTPNPALVTARAARRLPRFALLLLCAAYVLPGVFGRDPWRNADIAAFGAMAGIAEGRSSWWAPTVGGLPADPGPLPYGLGAVFIKLLSPAIDPAVAARIPFALLLVAVLVLVWYGSYHFARSEAAQPLPFAFGGEATPVDYARAIADGALLALIASLGLLQLGHETTPELAQLAGVALFVYALAVGSEGGWRGRLAVLVALTALAASGAPTIALALGVVGAAVCSIADAPTTRRFAPWVIGGAALASAVALGLDTWRWRVELHELSIAGLLNVVRLIGWFAWPAWLLAVWTVWRWRARLLDRHLAIPLGCAAVGVVACLLTGNSDRALMLALPPLALLAAFALPTLQRSAAAAVDWFSVCLFTIAAGAVWVVYGSMQTGFPAQPAINIARLSPGYVGGFSGLAFTWAAAGTFAWLWLVRWRTGRSHHALWKSLVLAASGVALCWLLVMTLLLPPLDHARSSRSLVQRIAQRVPAGACVAAPGMSKAQVAALEYFGRYRVDARTVATDTGCPWLLLTVTRASKPDPGAAWRLLTIEQRSRNDEEMTAIYGRR